MRIRHLSNKLVLAGLVMVLPIVIWSTWMQVRHMEANRSSIRSQHETVAEHVSDGCRNHMNELTALERSMGMALSNKSSLSYKEVSEYLSGVGRSDPFITHSALISPDGKILASDLAELNGLDVSDLPPVKDVMHGSPWSLSDVFTLYPVGDRVVAVNTGIRDAKGNLRGMVIAFSDRKHMLEVLKRDLTLGMNEGEVVVITDSKGRVFITSREMNLSPKQRQWLDFPFIKNAIAGKHTAIDDFKLPDGTSVVGVSQPIEGVRWTVSVFEPRSNTIDPIHRSTAFGSLIGLLVSGIAVAFAVRMGNRVARPIMSLANTARAFGKGDMSARVHIRTGDELELLGRSFNDMASALQQRTEELNESFEQESALRHRSSALYLVSQGLVVNSRLNDRLEVIAQALASICSAQRCAVFLRRGDHLAPVASWGWSRPECFPRLLVEIGENGGLVHEALLPGTPIVITDAANDPRVPPGIAEKFSIKGFLALPLVRKRHLVGLAVVDNPGEYPHFDEEAINTARSLSSLAAIAIENSESFEKSLRIAEAFQGAMLASIPRVHGEFELACTYYAAMQNAELGGDFYDLINFPDGRIGLVIADVSGKGLDAAIFTAQGKYTLRAFAFENPDPASVLTRTNSAIVGTVGDMGFITAFYGLLDPRTGKLTYAVAGHPAPLVAHADGQVTWLPTENREPPMGILSDIMYQQVEFTLNQGETLLCYTDGITEARRSGEMFDIDRLADLVKSSRELSPDDIARAVYQAVLEYSHGKIQDDIALMIAKRSNF